MFNFQQILFQKMSGFFSLSETFGINKDHDQQQQHEQQENNHHQNSTNNSINTPNSLYLFKNGDIYNKGFDLWQQYYQLHHRQPPFPPTHYDSCKKTTTNLDHLSLNNNSTTSDQENNNNLYASPYKVMRAAAGYGFDHGGQTGGINCQDCGNQAKKDCQHMRCRTCCKSRGFQCQTHVKSTWVPAAKRRERQQQLQSLTQPQQQNLGSNQQLSLMMRGDQNPKRLREDHQLMTTTTGGGGGVVSLNLPLTHHHHHHHHHNTSSGFEVGHFPAEVSSPAVFRCVKVSAMDEADEQLAYKTAVNIGGHLFKGILYDHGVEGASSSGGGPETQHQQLNLITAGTMGVATSTTTVHPNVTTSIDPSSIYPTPLNAFMAGTQFFPPPRS